MTRKNNDNSSLPTLSELHTDDPRGFGGELTLPPSDGFEGFVAKVKKWAKKAKLPPLDLKSIMSGKKPLRKNDKNGEGAK